MNIGIVGNLGSGKSTIANYLISQYGYEKLSLADPMRNIAKEYFGYLDKTNPKYRPFMQKLGTDWFRSEDPLVWVKYLKKRIENPNNLNATMHNEMGLFVVDDIRFMNEAEAMLDWGWVLLYLDCPLELRRKRCLERDGNFNEAALEHQSEKEVEQIKRELSSRMIILDASISMDEVPKQIDSVMKLITG